MKIIGIILLTIILIIAVALAFPVKVLAYTNENNKVKILYKWLFFTFGKKPNPNSPIIRFAKRCVGLSEFDSLEKIDERIESKGFFDAISDFFAVLYLLLLEVKYLLRRCRINKLNLKIINASDDCAQTAVTYGAICGVVYPVLSFIYSNTKHKRDFADVNIFCDFTKNKSEISFKTELSVTAFLVAIAFVRASISNYVNRKQNQ